MVTFSNFVRQCIISINKTVIILNSIVYLMTLGLKYVSEHKYLTMAVDLSANITYSPYFKFIVVGKLVLNYARTSGMHPSHKIRTHCIQRLKYLIKIEH